jgi:hypothetical protein
VEAVSEVANLYEMQSLPVQYVLDAMHCEKNVTENLLKTLFGIKDTPSVKVDLMNRRLRPHLHLQAVCGHGDRLYMPDAPYVLSVQDRKLFLDTLMELKMPSHYGSSLKNKVANGKFFGLKSHDFHILMQNVIPICLRNIGNGRVVGVVIRLSRLFRKICSKSVNTDDRQALFDECVETLCLLEKEIPPSFFDIMIHLTIHLVEELFLYGLVHVRWMYPYERYYKTLKSFVRNLAKPEGSMSKGYEIEEALGFAIEYMAQYSQTTRRVWDSQEDPCMVDEILEGKGVPREMEDQFISDIHAFVLDNALIIATYRE